MSDTHPCPSCDKVFENYERLHYHLKRSAAGCRGLAHTRTLSCDKCGKPFTETSLRQHLKSTKCGGKRRARVRPLGDPCPHCRLVFSDSGLLNHLRKTRCGKKEKMIMVSFDDYGDMILEPISSYNARGIADASEASPATAPVDPICVNSPSATEPEFSTSSTPTASPLLTPDAGFIESPSFPDSDDLLSPLSPKARFVDNALIDPILLSLPLHTQSTATSSNRSSCPVYSIIFPF